MSFVDFSQSQQYVINLYLAITDRAPTQQELNEGRQEIADSGVVGFSNTLLDEANLEEADGVSNEDFVLALYDNLLGRTTANGGVDQAGLDYWASFLDGVDSISRPQLAVHFQYTATLFQTTGDPAVDALINTGRINYETKTEIAVEDLDPDGTVDPVDPTDPADGGIRIDGREVVEGTDGDDTFISRGTLNEEVIVEGKAGTDELIADLQRGAGGSAEASLAFETNSVENIFLRNQDLDGDDQEGELGFINVDAELMKGVQQWWSLDSRADLVIEDVNILPTEITEDITIGMRSTDNQVDYEVYFDQLSLRAAPDESANSQVNYELRDLRTVGTNEAEPLGNLNIDGVRFELDGETITLRDTDDSTAIDDAKTYEELEAALQAALAAAQADDASLAGLSLSLSGSFDIPAEFNAGNEINNAGQIVSIVDSEGRDLENPTYTRNEDATGGFTLYGETSIGAPVTIANLITSNIVLDNVGAGSKGGDLVIGGMSTGDNSGSIGVEKFIVDVQRNSWLESLRSTNNDNVAGNVLSEIIVDNSDGFTGNLTINGNTPDPDGNQEDGYDTGAHGVENVRLWDSTALEGNATITAELNANVVPQYLNLNDQAPNTSGADNVDFNYNFGAGNDGLDLDIVNEVSSHEDFVLSIDSGAGNDSVNFNLGLGGDTIGGANPTDAVDTINQAMLNNVSIDTGAGDDMVDMEGTGEAFINTTTGDDTVYIAQDGQKANWTLFNNNAAVAYTGTNLAALQSDATGLAFLKNSFVTVNYLGFEARVEVPTINGSGLVTQRELGNAIKAAIADDFELSKLLSAQDGEGNILEITSRIDGATVADADLTFSATTLVDANGATQSGQAYLGSLNATEKNALYDLLNDSGVAIDSSASDAVNGGIIDGLTTAMTNNLVVGEVHEGLVGDNSDNETNTSVINVGSGTNMVVLADDDAAGGVSTQTLVFDGQWTKTSVVNFESATAAVEKDVMDFTSYLDGMVTQGGSSSTQSEVRTPTTLNGDATTEANSVTILNNVAFTATDTFAGLNGSNLLAAVNTNGNDPYAALADATLNAAAAGGQPANFVGAATDQIVFVENAANDGEYKVFHLTSDTGAATAADYTQATLLGTLDFGAELDATIDATIFA